MKNTETYNYLDGIVQKDADYLAHKGKTKIKIGLGRLEAYASYLVVPWLEGASAEVLRGLVETTLFSTVKDAAEFVNESMESENDTRFAAAWKAFHDLVLLLQERGKDVSSIENCYVAIFFSAIIMRNYFEASTEGNADSRYVKSDNRAIAERVFEAVKAKASGLPMAFSPEGTVLRKVEEMPLYLRLVSERAFSPA